MFLPGDLIKHRYAKYINARRVTHVHPDGIIETRAVATGRHATITRPECYRLLSRTLRIVNDSPNPTAAPDHTQSPISNTQRCQNG